MLLVGNCDGSRQVQAYQASVQAAAVWEGAREEACAALAEVLLKALAPRLPVRGRLSWAGMGFRHLDPLQWRRKNCPFTADAAKPNIRIIKLASGFT